MAGVHQGQWHGDGVGAQGRQQHPYPGFLLVPRGAGLDGADVPLSACHGQPDGGGIRTLPGTVPAPATIPPRMRLNLECKYQVHTHTMIVFLQPMWG